MVKILNDGGSVSISGEVFTNIAGDAASRCFGVKGMVGKTRESGLYQLLRKESMSKGVSVTFHDEGAVSIALHIAVDYGVNISVIAGSIIREVSYKVSEATGVPVKAVDVYVDSILAD